MKKINLKEFQNEQLSIEERMHTKAGSGKTCSKRSCTFTTATDRDYRTYDRD